MVHLRSLAQAARPSARAAGRCLVGLALLLIATNFAGVLRTDSGALSSLASPLLASAAVMRSRPLHAPQSEFALREYGAAIESGEPFVLTDATCLVHAATHHSDDRRIAVTENWLQWLLAKAYPPLAHVQLTERLIAGRVANCSERSQILKSLAEAAGQRCRFVGLTGHVVLEVEENGQWRVADPGYDLVYPFDLRALEQPEQASYIRAQLHAAGNPPPVIEQYISLVQTPEDNVRMPVGSALSPRLYRAELACAWLVWLIPAACLVLGVRLIRGQGIRWRN